MESSKTALESPCQNLSAASSLCTHLENCGDLSDLTAVNISHLLDFHLLIRREFSGATTDSTALPRCCQTFLGSLDDSFSFEFGYRTEYMKDQSVSGHSL